MKKVSFLLPCIALLLAISNASAQTVSISTIDAFASEEPGETASFQVSRTGGMISAALAVDVGVNAANTQAGLSDYTLTPPLAGLTIPAGATSVTITMTATDETIAEAEEELTLQVLANANYAIDTNNLGTATISANDYGVTNTNDFDEFGSPTPEQREGTLRQALENANNLGQTDPIITFSNDPFTTGVAQTITLTGGELTILEAVTIEGPGADRLTLEGGGTSRIIRVLDEESLVILSGMTFQSGAALTTGPEGRGGAILAESDRIEMRLIECAFVENRAVEGGAVAFADVFDGTLLVERCLFDQNTSTVEGGALAFSSGSLLTIRDTTFTRNESSGRAAALLIQAPALITNATIVGNRTDEDNGGQPGDTGGGLFVEPSVNCVMHNTLIVGNLRGGATPTDDDIFGNVATESRNNLIGDPATAGGIVHGVQENLLGMSDPFNPAQRAVIPLNRVVETIRFNISEPLVEDHGGPTRAVRLQRAGPAISKATTAIAISATDQRGTGFPRSLAAFPSLFTGQSGQPDIGALEFDPILVTTVTDENDGTPDSATGDGTSLREAIEKANEAPGLDLIVFSRGGGSTTNFFDVAAPKTMRPTSEFSVTSWVEIEGPGSFFLTIDGDVDQSGTANDGDIRLFSFTDPIPVTGVQESSLRQVSLINGSNWVASALGNGGAILNDSSLILSQLVLRNNTALDGGAIYNSGVLNLITSTIEDNSSQRNGGGLYTEGTLTAIQQSTFSNNTASQSGGAIFTENASFQLLNSTLSANTAPDGGGLCFAGGDARVANSTIAENSASNSTSGGGIHFDPAATAPLLELDNTIVAGNLIAVANQPSDIRGGTIGTGSINNLIGDSATAGGLIDGTDGNIVGDGGTGTLEFSNILEPIGFDDGFTQVYLPVFDSRVIDSGDDNSASFRTGAALRTDQRGVDRILGFAVDIGSVESRMSELELDTIGSQFIGEDEPLFFTASATDNSGIGGNIIFSLEDGAFGFVPGSASINPTTGDFEWTPDEEEGPEIFEFDVVATLEDDPSITARETVFVEVFEINENPTLDPISDMTVAAGVQLSFTATASDPDVPNNDLFFSLDTASTGLGMVIDTNTGAFTWTPSSPGSYPVEVTVEDDGGGDVPLADITSFNIVVTGGSMPVVSLSNTIPFTIEPDSFSGATGSSGPNFSLTRSSAMGTQAVTLQIDGTSIATLGDDFTVAATAGGAPITLNFTGTPLSATVTMPDTVTLIEFTLSPIDDFAAEPDEPISFSIVPDASFSIGTPSITNTIAQNDYGVTNINDFDPATDPAAGEGTLRQAVINAKAGLVLGTNPPVPAEIEFQTGLVGDLLLSSGALLLDTADFSITGPGSDALTITAGLSSRIFISYDPAADREYTITGLRIDSGFTTRNGGGIFNTEQLWLADCVISNCVANHGGGITNEGTLNVERCVVTSNAAAVYGGGIDNHTGTLNISASTIANNTARFGGGIEDYRGNLTSVTASTIAGNTATASGGGIDAFGSRHTIYNSTISNNTADYGAGVFNEMSSLSIDQTTVVGNTATSSTGGVLTSSAPSDVAIISAGTTLLNTIVAGNMPSDLSTDDPSFSDISSNSSNNLIGDADSSGGLVDGINANLVGIDGAGIRPLDTILASLADNGGPTLTHALLFDSPAINAGNRTSDDTGDQRGRNFTRIATSVSDIGSFEYDPLILKALSCELTPGSAAKITWRSTAGEKYDLLCSIDLKNWITVATAIPATGTETSYTDENAPLGQAYFVIRKSQPE